MSQHDTHHHDHHGAECCASHHESDDWFIPFCIENLAVVILVCLSIFALIEGTKMAGLTSGVVLAAMIVGAYFRGREGLAMIGAGAGYLLAGPIGLPWGLALGWFNGWILGMDAENEGRKVLRPLGWLNGAILSCIMGFATSRGNGAIEGIQWIIALGLYAFFGGFIAENLPAFGKFVRSLGK